jgi:preprotein translocase subunit SecG
MKQKALKFFGILTILLLISALFLSITNKTQIQSEDKIVNAPMPLSQILIYLSIGFGGICIGLFRCAWIKEDQER